MTLSKQIVNASVETNEKELSHNSVDHRANAPCLALKSSVSQVRAQMMEYPFSRDRR
jgi:hypothetical protein